MARLFFPLLMTACIAFAPSGCSDELPPLPDTTTQNDGGTLDGPIDPDGISRPDVAPPPDGASPCDSNRDCDGDIPSYCKLATGCEGPGYCAPRPTSCMAEPFPVCGCDGQTYDHACAAAAAGVNVAKNEECAPRTCMGAVDCYPHEFCNLDYHCGATSGDLGFCEPKPAGCPDYGDPVCGCDNQTHSTACEAHINGVSVQHDGPCIIVVPPECGVLEGKYALALAQAKVCRFSRSGPEYLCDEEVMSELKCPCPTFVPSANASEVEELAELMEEWITLGCAPDGTTCPGCAPPNGAACTSNGGRSGDAVCVDN